MPECLVCGEAEFEEHNGHFFCTTCNTQSQDLRVLEADDETAIYDRSQRIYEKKTTQKKKDSKYEGRPWSSYEAFEIILLHQVEALIKLGAQPVLKDIVFKIWANYLSKLGVAFSDNTATRTLQRFERQRELFPGTSEKPKVKNVLGRKARKITLGLSQKQAEEETERTLIQEELQGQEFDEGEDLLESGQRDTEDGDEWNTDEEFFEEDSKKWGSKRKTLVHRSVYKVKKASLLCICYLGLMYTNPLVTTADLLRWARTGKIPFRKVIHLIPDDMKFFLNDWKMFRGDLPSAVSLRNQVGRIADLLNLSEFPEFPLSQLVNKYIVELQLPAEFHGFAMNVFTNLGVSVKFSTHNRRKCLPFYEGFAMATIILSLKLIFGLDDTTERLLSRKTRDLMAVCQCSKQLFVWDDWVINKKTKQNLIDAELATNKLDPLDEEEEDCDASLKHVEETALVESFRISRKYQIWYKQNLLEPFSELSKRWNNPDDDDHDNNQFYDFETQNPGRRGSQISTPRPIRRSGATNFQTIKTKLKEEGVQFRTKILQHLIDPSNLQEFLGITNKGAEEKMAEANKAGKSRTESAETEDNDSDKDIFEFESPKKKMRTYNKKDKKVALERAENRKSKNIEVTQVSDVAEYQKIIHDLQTIKDNFLMAFNYESKSKYTSVTYSWLLGLCSNMIESEADLVHEEVAKAEIKLFGNPEDLNSRQKIHFNKLKNRARDCNYFTQNLKFN